MARKTKEELMEALKGFIGEDSSDDALTFVEDLNDTIDELANSDGENWKQKYEDNDKAWRQKYRDRFFNAGGSEPGDNEEDERKVLTFEELFKEV